MAFPNDFHRALIGDFLDAVEHRRPPRISGHEALKVHRLIDCLLESAETGGTVIL
jgi:predicted dehydrogenase